MTHSKYDSLSVKPSLARLVTKPMTWNYCIKYELKKSLLPVLLLDSMFTTRVVTSGITFEIFL